MGAGERAVQGEQVEDMKKVNRLNKLLVTVHRHYHRVKNGYASQMQGYKMLVSLYNYY